MDKLNITARLKTNLTRFLQPSIILPNRLEGNPRVEEFNRNLSAEVRDPLWMLCRQWQFGEFIGEDAGTVSEARILGEHHHPNAINIKENRLAYDAEKIPLETMVERETLSFTLHLKSQCGRQWSRLLKKNNLKAYQSLFIDKYPLEVENNDKDKEGQYLSTALEGLFPDGEALFEDLQNGKYEEWVNSSGELIEEEDKEALMQVKESFEKWFENLYSQPNEKESAWSGEHLEYNFSLLTEENSTHRLTAEQYASGHLDWYSFNQKGIVDDVKDENSKIQTFIPMPLRYGGMPHPRYWQMEENVIDFGKIDASPTSLMSLLLAHYGLNYSNDWFILPYEMKINTLCDIRGIMVRDVFGVHSIIEPAVEDIETNWHQFALFHQTKTDVNTQNRSQFYLAPVVGKLMKGETLERVNIMRDEAANLVWAIENRLPSNAGGSFDNKYRNLTVNDNFNPVGEEAKIRYVVGTSVPENMIPFISVHKDDTETEMRFQRARLPGSIGAQGKLLNENQPVYFIEEEEVPKSGIIIERNFQRTRWLNGKTFLWVGRRKKVGREKTDSKLRFDQIDQI